MKYLPKPENELIIQWLLDHPIAAIWAGMGLGKTASTLTAFTGLQLLGQVKAALLVAPLRVSNLTWPNEVEQWDHLQHLRLANLRTKEGMKSLREGTSDIYHINYESIPRLCREYLCKVRHPAFDLVIFDESTFLKNASGKRSRALRKLLRGRVSRRWGLTGTPVPNSLLEIFNQVRMLDDGARLGESADHFKRTYFHPTDYMEYNWVINGPEAERTIHEKVSDIALTLKLEEYADWTAPVVEDIDVPLPTHAKEAYEELEKELLLSLGDEDNPVIAPNTAVLSGKLVQLTSGAVYREDKTVAIVHDAKIKALTALLKRLRKDRPGLPVLIACNYRHEQLRVKEAVRGVCWRDFKDETALLAKWNAKRIPTLITDPRSIGHGLNLQQGGHIVIWYSPPWSNELYDQLNSRLARRGQKETTLIYRLVSPGTIDDAIVETLRQRVKVGAELFTTLKNLRKLKQ